jgi:hypothetical protein
MRYPLEQMDSTATDQLGATGMWDLKSHDAPGLLPPAPRLAANSLRDTDTDDPLGGEPISLGSGPASESPNLDWARQCSEYGAESWLPRPCPHRIDRGGEAYGGGALTKALMRLSKKAIQ